MAKKCIIFVSYIVDYVYGENVFDIDFGIQEEDMFLSTFFDSN